MCKVYNEVGCLTAIKAHLREHNIDFQSLADLIDFKKNYVFARQKIISNHQLLIEREKKMLSVEVVQLEDSIKAKKELVEQQLRLTLDSLKHRLGNLPITYPNVTQTVIGYIKKIWLKLKIRLSVFTFNFRVAYAIRPLIKAYTKRNSRYQFILSRPEDAVMESCLPQLQEFDKKKDAIDQINNVIYGALGEQQVERELEKLGDECILINDFNCKFHPPIYNQREKSSIRSVQIDHILVTLSGVFIIETKNWSQKSVDNLSLYSPVQQVKRAGFAIYKVLNRKLPNKKLILKKHHWGDQQIPTRNLVVLTNYKPIGEFQHVKILTLNNLLSYVKYFEPCFSNDETLMIASHLLKISGVNNA